jgi:hypothetical protein
MSARSRIWIRRIEKVWTFAPPDAVLLNRQRLQMLQVQYKMCINSYMTRDSQSVWEIPNLYKGRSCYQPVRLINYDPERGQSKLRQGTFYSRAINGILLDRHGEAWP